MPTIVQTVLQKMGNVYKPRVQVMTTLLTTILVLCGKVNITNLSRYSVLERPLIAVVDVIPKASYSINAQQTYNQIQNPLLTRTDYALVHLDQARQHLPKRVHYLA